MITNGGVQSQRDKLKSLGAARWFRPELVLISDALGVMKPGPEIFRIAEQAAWAHGRRIASMWVIRILRMSRARAAAAGRQSG